MNHSKNDNHSETSTDEKTVTARSYECTFCKRGFTNAQALGGHMNIHRKDKAKAKAKANQKAQTNSSFSTHENHMISSRYNFSPTYYDQQITNYQVALNASINNYHNFYVPVLNVPNYSYPGYGYYQTTLPDYHPVANSENIFRLHEENLGVSLSLDVGLSNMEEGKMKNRFAREDRVEHELYLELRLGYDP